MLPPGHIAAGYLTAYTLLKVIHPALSAAQIQQLAYWGMFFGFIPDWDMFVTFAKERALTVNNPEKTDHRNFWNHAPILWLAAGLLVYLFAPSVYWKCFGLIVWLASWSHFLLDSIEHGIMWLWPFSKKRFAIKSVNAIKIDKSGFFKYWTEFLKAYSTKTVTFYLELAVILTALIIYFR